MGIGEAAGLGAAAIWAMSSLLYSFARMTAWELNYWKNVIASVIFLVHLWVVRTFFEPGAVFSAPLEAWYWLGLSSVLGIVVGDTVYLRSLQIMGARRALVVATVAPIFGVIVGYLVMGDPVTLSLLGGVGLTVFGVGIVVADKKAEVENPNVYPGNFSIGMILGVGAAFCQAVSVALAKIGMNYGCQALESSMIRIVVAAGSMTLLVLIFPARFAKSRHLVKVSPEDTPGWTSSREISPDETITLETSITKPLFEWYSMKFFIPGVLMGTWIGIWFFQIAQQYTDTAVVTTLVSTCPIFAIPVVWWVQGHRVSLKGIIGTGIGVCGIYWVVKLSAS